MTSSTNNNYGAHLKIDNSELLGEMKHPTTIVSFQKPHPSKSIHPTQKPVALYQYLVRTYTNEGDLVLDISAGSFTTGVACLNTGRNFIGIEKEEKYFLIGADRMEKRRQEINDYVGLDLFPDAKTKKD